MKEEWDGEARGERVVRCGEGVLPASEHLSFVVRQSLEFHWKEK